MNYSKLILIYVLLFYISFHGSSQKELLIEFEKDKNILTETGYDKFKQIHLTTLKWMNKYRIIFNPKHHTEEYHTNNSISYDRYRVLKDSLIVWGYEGHLIGLSSNFGIFNESRYKSYPSGLTYGFLNNICQDSLEKFSFVYTNVNELTYTEKRKLKQFMNHLNKCYNFQFEIIIQNFHNENRKYIGFLRGQWISSEIVKNLRKHISIDNNISINYFEADIETCQDSLVIYFSPY